MRFAELLLRTALAAACLGCDPRPHQTAEVDLTLLEVGLVDGIHTRLSIAEEAGARRLLQPPHSRLQLYVRAPADSEFVFGLTPELDAPPLSLSVETDDHETTLNPKRGDRGSWRAPLEVEPGPIRLTLENDSSSVLAWIEPKLVGVASRREAILGADERAGAPANVILYVVDTLRADHLSLYGYHRATSPNLDAFGGRSLVFLNAYAPGAATPLSVSSLFASRHPSELRSSLTPELAEVTLAEAFKASGYETAAFQANYRLIPGLGFGRGFDRYVAHPSQRSPAGSTLRAGELHGLALEWLQSAGEPFFLYVQSMDVHDYDPPAPFRGRFRSTSENAPPLPPEMAEALDGVSEKQVQKLLKMHPDSYDETIAYADHEIGRLLAEVERLGLHERTAIAITADHGEPLGEHGVLFHGFTLYEELVRVPLIVFLPWESSGTRVEEIVGLMDLGPTLLDLVGIPIPEPFEGRSLFEPFGVLEEPSAVGVAQPLGVKRPASWYLRSGPWKLIKSEEKTLLFHLPSDPDEERDLSATRPVVTGYLTAELMRRSPSLREGWRNPPAPERDLSQEEQEELERALRALGYIE